MGRTREVSFPQWKEGTCCTICTSILAAGEGQEAASSLHTLPGKFDIANMSRLWALVKWCSLGCHLMSPQTALLHFWWTQRRPIACHENTSSHGCRRNSTSIASKLGLCFHMSRSCTTGLLSCLISCQQIRAQPSNLFREQFCTCQYQQGYRQLWELFPPY